MIHTFHQLPLELFYEIAIHLPLTKDVLAFTLTNSRIRGALSTPALFKARLSLRGWDVSAWKDEDDAAQSTGDLKRWMCIDHTYCTTSQLFEEAAVDGYFLITPESPTNEAVLWRSARPDSDPRQDNRSSDLRPVFDGDKTVIWLKKLSRVFPLFVTHHRGGNISQITDPKYWDVLRAYARVVDDLSVVVGIINPDDTLEVPHPIVAPSDYGWLECICFSMIALLIQCDTRIIVSIFPDSNTSESTGNQSSETPSSPVVAAFAFAMNQPLVVPSDASLTLETMSELYFRTFIFQSALCVRLHLDAARAGGSECLPLLAPLLAHFDPCSSPCYSYYSHFGEDAPVERGSPTISKPQQPAHPTPPSSSPTTSPTSHSFHMRPWLRDRLAGTPLAGLSSTTGSAWAGYYTYFGLGRGDSPMYLELRFKPLPPYIHVVSESIESICMYGLVGKGYDGVGPFTISGECDERTGVVKAIKAYETHKWGWNGMLTPFGIAGTWGRWGGGWFWIWPQEWSPTMAQHD